MTFLSISVYSPVQPKRDLLVQDQPEELSPFSGRQAGWEGQAFLIFDDQLR